MGDDDDNNDDEDLSWEGLTLCLFADIILRLVCAVKLCDPWCLVVGLRH